MRGTHYSKQLPSDSAERVVARLKRDDPALAQEVINGTKSANKAALQKGWRKPRIILAKPETVAKALTDHMSRDAIQYIANHLASYLKEKEN